MSAVSVCQREVSVCACSVSVDDVLSMFCVCVSMWCVCVCVWTGAGTRVTEETGMKIIQLKRDNQEWKGWTALRQRHVHYGKFESRRAAG